MATLMQITADFQAIDALLDEADGDISGVEATIEAWFAELQGNLEAKLAGYVSYCKELDGRSKARAELATQLGKLVKADRSTLDFLKHRMRAVFEERGIKKMEVATGRITLADN